MRLSSLVAPGLALVLAACGAPRAAGPAWPQRAETEEDGGESLAPRRAIALTGAEAKPKPDADADADAAGSEDAAAEPEDAPAASSEDGTPGAAGDDLVITADEEVIDLDDIVIEIEDE